MKTPYFPFYPGDYLADTIGLSCCEHGVYLLLLAVSWQRGPLPDDMDHLSRLTANPPIEALRHILQEYWTLDERGWLNKRMEAERALVEAKFKRRSEAGKKAISARWAKDTNRIPIVKQSNTNQNQNQISNTHPSDESTKKPQNSGSSVRRITVPMEKILDLWRKILPELPQPHGVEYWTDARKAQIRARWNNELPDLDTWQEMMGAIRKSPFLMGKVAPRNGHKQFRCDLFWITKPENLLKLMEGRYHG